MTRVTTKRAGNFWWIDCGFFEKVPGKPGGWFHKIFDRDGHYCVAIVLETDAGETFSVQDLLKDRKLPVMKRKRKR